MHVRYTAPLSPFLSVCLSLFAFSPGVCLSISLSVFVSESRVGRCFSRPKDSTKSKSHLVTFQKVGPFYLQANLLVIAVQQTSKLDFLN